MFLTSLFVLCLQFGEETKPITTDDYFSMSYVSSCSISPRGMFTAWAEGRWDKTWLNRWVNESEVN